MNTTSMTSLLATLSLACFACGNPSTEGTGFSDADSGMEHMDPDGAPPPEADIHDIDILLMIDNSGSMMEEQMGLRLQLERMFEVLSSGDLDKDGTLDFEALDSIRFGVVSSDMGAGGNTVSTCGNGDVGDDGVLQTLGDGSGCGIGSTSGFLTFTGDEPDTATQFATDAQCMATLGLGGCGFEQQLESLLKALTPSTSPIRFAGDSVGHGDRANAGFLREDSLLAIISLTDEDDCSSPETDELFDPSSSRYTGGLNLRCHEYKDALYPTSRYVDGLLALREDPSRVLFATIAGMPVDLVEDVGTDYERLLNDERMQERVDPADPTSLVSVCNTADTGLAFPARRLISVAQQLEERGANGIVQSICQLDYSLVIDEVLTRISAQLPLD